MVRPFKNTSFSLPARSLILRAWHASSQLAHQLVPTAVQASLHATQTATLTSHPACRRDGRIERNAWRTRAFKETGAVGLGRLRAPKRLHISPLWRAAHNWPRVGKKADDGSSCWGRNQEKRHREEGWDRVGRHDWAPKGEVWWSYAQTSWLLLSTDN